MLIFEVADPEVVQIAQEIEFRLIKVLQQKKLDTGEPLGIEFGLERVDEKTRSRAKLHERVGSATVDSDYHIKKGAPKRLHFAVVSADEAIVAPNFALGFEASPKTTSTRRRWRRIRGALLGLNTFIEEPGYAEPESEKPNAEASKQDWTRIRQLLFGLNKSLVAKLISSGRMQEYIAFTQTTAQDQLHQNTTTPDETASVPIGFAEEELVQKKTFSVNEIVERVNAESDPLKKLRIFQTAIEDITKITAVKINSIPDDKSRQITDLFSTLKDIYQVFKRPSVFPGSKELVSFFRKRQIHTQSFDSDNIEADPAELWGGRRWKTKIRRLVHTDTYERLELNKATMSKIENIAQKVSQILDQDDGKTDIIQLALLLHEVFELTASQSALEAYKQAVPLFGMKISQAIELLQKKVQYYNEFSTELELFGTGQHPLEIGALAMEEHLRSLINEQMLTPKPE